jgi:hypothetical protein
MKPTVNMKPRIDDPITVMAWAGKWGQVTVKPCTWHYLVSGFLAFYVHMTEAERIMFRNRNERANARFFIDPYRIR